MIGGRCRWGPIAAPIENRHRYIPRLHISIQTDCFVSSPLMHRMFPLHASHQKSERINMLKSEFIAASEKNAELKKQIRELTEKLQLAEQGKDSAQKQVLVLGEQQKAGPFGTVKGLRTNPSVVPDQSINPRLAKILSKKSL